MWFRRLDPFRSGFFTAIGVGIVVGAIVSVGSQVNVVEMPRQRCQDTVVRFAQGVHCPVGTFVSMAGDRQGQVFVECHCKRPLRVIMQVKPGDLPGKGQDNPQPLPPLPPYHNSVTL